MRSGRVAGVRTSHGEVATSSVLLATNAWTPSLVPWVRHAVTPIREHIIVTEPVPPLVGPGLETNQCNEYWRQMKTGEVLIGGFAAADEGMGIGTYDDRGAAAGTAAAGAAAVRASPVDARCSRHPGSGRACSTSPRSRCRSPGRSAPRTARIVPGAYLGCGLTGHGLPYAPILGLLLAELIAEGAARTLPLDALRPASLRGPHAGAHVAGAVPGPRPGLTPPTSSGAAAPARQPPNEEAPRPERDARRDSPHRQERPHRRTQPASASRIRCAPRRGPAGSRPPTRVTPSPCHPGAAAHRADEQGEQPPARRGAARRAATRPRRRAPGEPGRSSATRGEERQRGAWRPGLPIAKRGEMRSCCISASPRSVGSVVIVASTPARAIPSSRNPSAESGEHGVGADPDRIRPGAASIRAGAGAKSVLSRATMTAAKATSQSGRRASGGPERRSPTVAARRPASTISGGDAVQRREAAPP